MGFPWLRRKMCSFEQSINNLDFCVQHNQSQPYKNQIVGAPRLPREEDANDDDHCCLEWPLYAHRRGMMMMRMVSTMTQVCPLEWPCDYAHHAIVWAFCAAVVVYHFCYFPDEMVEQCHFCLPCCQCWCRSSKASADPQEYGPHLCQYAPVSSLAIQRLSTTCDATHG